MAKVILIWEERMYNLSLVFPKANHEKLWHDIIAEFQQAQEKITPYGLIMRCSDYKDFLLRTIYGNTQIVCLLFTVGFMELEISHE